MFLFLFQLIEIIKVLFWRLKLKMFFRWELLWLDLIAILTTTKFSRSSYYVFPSTLQDWYSWWFLVGLCGYRSLCSAFGNLMLLFNGRYGTLCIRENPGCLFIATNRDAVTHLTDAQEWAGWLLVCIIFYCFFFLPVIWAFWFYSSSLREKASYNHIM